MKILILEDNLEKSTHVREEIKKAHAASEIALVENFRDFAVRVSQTKFDLIVADLVVPNFARQKETQDMTDEIINLLREEESINRSTPVIALTGYNATAERKFKNLNANDITVVTYDEHGEWRECVRNKVAASVPSEKFDFVILCALEKEANAYAELGYKVGERQVSAGLTFQKIDINGHCGVIVTSPRMGLVSAAITCTRAIDIFNPRLVCMSGISAGVHSKSNIYDVVIPEICHQNDAGKWTEKGFELEAYPVQLDHVFKLHLERIIKSPDFVPSIAAGIQLRRSEFPSKSEVLGFKVYCAPASSGSSVIADEEAVGMLKGQHRKLSAFEMESFAIYEAARLSPSRPLYFSAKAVVDNGTLEKNDDFHRVACILSARVVYELIDRGVLAHHS
jgi:nucleoside phosphorylase